MSKLIFFLGGLLIAASGLSAIESYEPSSSENPAEPDKPQSDDTGIKLDLEDKDLNFINDNLCVTGNDVETSCEGKIANLLRRYAKRRETEIQKGLQYALRKNYAFLSLVKMALIISYKKKLEDLGGDSAKCPFGYGVVGTVAHYAKDERLTVVVGTRTPVNCPDGEGAVEDDSTLIVIFGAKPTKEGQSFRKDGLIYLATVPGKDGSRPSKTFFGDIGKEVVQGRRYLKELQRDLQKYQKSFEQADKAFQKLQG